MNNYGRIQNHGLALLLSSLGVNPDIHPGQLPPRELMLLGALSVRDAQLASAVDNMNVAVQARYDAEDRADEAEEKLGNLKISLQGLSDAAKDLYDEAEDALDEAEDKATLSDTSPYDPYPG